MLTTRTENIRGSEAIEYIHSMEDAGWAVRQAVAMPDNLWLLIVFEREG